METALTEEKALEEKISGRKYLPKAFYYLVLISLAGLIFASYTDEEYNRLERLRQKSEDKRLTIKEQEEYCYLNNKINGLDYDSCLNSFQTKSVKKGKASTKNEQKSNLKRTQRFQDKIDSLQLLMNQSKYPPLTKKEKWKIQKDINHWTRKKKDSENHAQKKKR